MIPPLPGRKQSTKLLVSVGRVVGLGMNYETRDGSAWSKRLRKPKVLQVDFAVGLAVLRGEPGTCSISRPSLNQQKTCQHHKEIRKPTEKTVCKRVAVQCYVCHAMPTFFVGSGHFDTYLYYTLAHWGAQKILLSRIKLALKSGSGTLEDAHCLVDFTGKPKGGPTSSLGPIPER